MKTLFIGVGILLLLILQGCLYTPQPAPQVKATEQEDEHIKLSLKKSIWDYCVHYKGETSVQQDFKGFKVTIQNKTDKTIEIDWNKSSYINNGQTDSGFMYSGVKYIDRNNISRRSDFIMPGSSYKKDILPNKFAFWSEGYKGQGVGWGNTCLPANSNNSGIMVVYKINGKEYFLPVQLGYEKQITSHSTTKVTSHSTQAIQANVTTNDSRTKDIETQLAELQEQFKKKQITPKEYKQRKQEISNQ